MNEFSRILFARPSAIEGAARILDFANVLSAYNSSPTPQMADGLAIGADWHAVGGDILFATQMQAWDASGVAQQTEKAR